MDNAEPSTSDGRKGRNKRKIDACAGYCGLTPEEVQNVSKYVMSSDEDEREEPFADSGSEFVPSSEGESSEDDYLQVSEGEDNKHDSPQTPVLENVTTMDEIMDIIRERKRLEIKWTDKEFIPQVFAFDSTNSGLKNVSLNNESSEVDFFLSLLSENIMNVIAIETNRYAIQKDAPKWKSVDIPELYVFFAVTLLMTRVKKLNIKEYWTQDILLSTPVFGQTMSRNRYCEIHRYLHFANNEEVEAHNRLGKFGNILTVLKENFKSQFYPFEHLVIDESMVLFKGRLSFRQYIKTKRHKFGIKLYVLCDCETGIVLDFIVYVGKGTQEDTRGLGATGEIVTNLLQPYMNKGHSLFTDNFYTSPTLSTFLFQNKTNSCGTVKQNRKEMPILDKNLKRGECDWRSSENMLVVKWKDRRDVTMLTTLHENKMVRLPRKDRVTNENLQKPLCVLEYNKQMGAVDRSDMMISSIDSTRKSIKWYKKLFFHTIDISLLNAHAMYLTQNSAKVPLATFQLAVIRQLLERYLYIFLFV